jgi:hypothetical protein
VGYWAGGAREAGWWQWAGVVKVSWMHLWVESEVCYSLIREFSCSNTGTVNTVGKQSQLFLFL